MKLLCLLLLVSSINVVKSLTCVLRNETLPTPLTCTNSGGCSNYVSCNVCIHGTCSTPPTCGAPCFVDADCKGNAAKLGCGVCSLCTGNTTNGCEQSTNPGTCIPALETPPEPDAWWITLLKWIAIIVLLSITFTFSGLNLGLMGLDIFTLRIYVAGGTKSQKRYAKAVLPIRKHGNLLLCTILFVVSAVNSLLPILIVDVTSELVSFVLSTTLLVLFGEIVPQALFSRFALAFSAYTIWLVWFFVILFFPISYPVSKVLDFLLGDELGTIYKREELKTFLDLHKKTQHGDLTNAERQIMNGALNLSTTNVEDIMTPMDDIYILNVKQRVTFDLLSDILATGYSRFPVYEDTKDRIVGIILVKDLVLLDPNLQTPLKTVVAMYSREMFTITAGKNLERLLVKFKTGASHFALVTQNDMTGQTPVTGAIGVVTLEDVLEEILQDKILDETDVHTVSVDRIDYRSPSPFRMYQNKGEGMPPNQLKAIQLFLTKNCKIFSPRIIDPRALKKVIVRSNVYDVTPQDGDHNLLYTRGEQSKEFTLVLHGGIQLEAFADEVIAEVGAFTFFGVEALTKKTWVPDFTARVIRKAQILRIKKKLYETAVGATKLANMPRGNRISMTIDLVTDKKKLSHLTSQPKKKKKKVVLVGDEAREPLMESIDHDEEIVGDDLVVNFVE